MASIMGGSVGRIVAVLLLVALAGCNRVQAAYTVQGHLIPTPAQSSNFEQITAAIVEAAQSAGWQAERLGQGEVRASQKWHDHVAIVRITHTDKVFSIRNDGSTNLRASGDWIHKEYNSRVQKLEGAIEQRLQRL